MICLCAGILAYRLLDIFIFISVYSEKLFIGFLIFFIFSINFYSCLSHFLNSLFSFISPTKSYQTNERLLWKVYYRGISYTLLTVSSKVNTLNYIFGFDNWIISQKIWIPKFKIKFKHRMYQRQCRFQEMTKLMDTKGQFLSWYIRNFREFSLHFETSWNKMHWKLFPRFPSK